MPMIHPPTESGFEDLILPVLSKLERFIPSNIHLTTGIQFLLTDFKGTWTK